MIAITARPEHRPQPESADPWVPFAFAAFCLVVLAANGTLIAIAVATWPGLETTDAFRKGLAYNTALATAREQEALGWRGELVFAPTRPGRGRLELELSDAAGRPIERAQVRAAFSRPAQAGHDFMVALSRHGGGVYALETAFPLAGAWDVRLLAEDNADRFGLAGRIMVP